MRHLLLPVLAAALAASAQAADKQFIAASTDLSLGIVALDPPPGSTLQAGEVVHALIEWRYSRPHSPVGVWLKLEVPDDVDWSYDGDHDEARAGSGGRIERYVGLQVPGHIDSVLLVAKDADSHEIYRRRVKVAYTWVADPQQEARRKDGLGSRITGVTLDPSSPARLAPGTTVDVRIAYDAHSRLGVRPVAIPVTSCAMTYNGLVEAVDGRGAVVQYFTVGEPCALRQLRVQLVNDGGVAVAEQLVDVDLRYER